MKEITRRLYTKPVMLGLSLLAGMVLLAGLFVTTRNAQATTFIPKGDDTFETTGNGETYHNFAASKVPAHFFGQGSQEYAGSVPLVGVPLAAGSDIDTIIKREQDVTIPGSPTTTLRMTGLSLKSIAPITVTFPNRTEAWDVYVGLSIFKASTGSMTLSAGGTFDSSLKVWPRFTFKRVSDQSTLVLDTGDPNGPGLTAASDTAVAQEFIAEPVPAPTVAPCPVVIDEFEGPIFNGSSAASASSCAPVTLTSTNSPWQFCNGIFCIPRPLTEAELLAAHNASPPGTKKKILQTKGVAAGD